MAQLVATVSSVVLGGVAEVVGSNLAIGSVGSIYPSVYIYNVMVLICQRTPISISLPFCATCIVRPVKRDWAFLSKDTPLDISI